MIGAIVCQEIIRFSEKSRERERDPRLSNLGLIPDTDASLRIFTFQVQPATFPRRVLPDGDVDEARAGEEGRGRCVAGRKKRRDGRGRKQQLVLPTGCPEPGAKLHQARGGRRDRRGGSSPRVPLQVMRRVLRLAGVARQPRDRAQEQTEEHVQPVRESVQNVRELAEAHEEAQRAERWGAEGEQQRVHGCQQSFEHKGEEGEARDGVRVQDVQQGVQTQEQLSETLDAAHGR